MLMMSGVVQDPEDFFEINIIIHQVTDVIFDGNMFERGYNFVCEVEVMR